MFSLPPRVVRRPRVQPSAYAQLASTAQTVAPTVLDGTATVLDDSTVPAVSPIVLDGTDRTLPATAAATVLDMTQDPVVASTVVDGTEELALTPMVLDGTYALAVPPTVLDEDDDMMPVEVTPSTLPASAMPPWPPTPSATAPPAALPVAPQPDAQPVDMAPKRSMSLHEDGGAECMICLHPLVDLEAQEVCALRCGHVYHGECFQTWLTTNRRGECPQCKQLCPPNQLRMLHFEIAEVPFTSLDEVLRIEAMSAEQQRLLENTWVDEAHEAGRELRSAKEELAELQICAREKKRLRLEVVLPEIVQQEAFIKEVLEQLSTRNMECSEMQTELDAMSMSQQRRMPIKDIREGDADLAEEKRVLRNVRPSDRVRQLHEDLVMKRHHADELRQVGYERKREADVVDLELKKMQQDSRLRRRLSTRQEELLLERQQSHSSLASSSSAAPAPAATPPSRLAEPREAGGASSTAAVSGSSRGAAAAVAAEPQPREDVSGGGGSGGRAAGSNGPGGGHRGGAVAGDADMDDDLLSGGPKRRTGIGILGGLGRTPVAASVAASAAARATPEPAGGRRLGAMRSLFAAQKV